MRQAARVWWATRQLRRGGDPASYVAAAPVRQHLAVLEAAGWSRRRVAGAAQVAPATLTRIGRPDTRWCSRIVAGAVLGVEP